MSKAHSNAGTAMPLYLNMIWKTQQDANFFPICKELEGYTWTIQPGETCPKKLCHSTYGPVYDTIPIVEGSLVKEWKGHMYRCSIKQEFNISYEACGETKALKKSVGNTNK